MDELDHQLINLLRGNARLSVADLAHKLKVSRGTVTNRLRKLEDTQTVVGYTVRLRPEAEPDLEARLRERLAAWGLPVDLSGHPQLDPAAVPDELRRDKKRRSGRLTLVLPLAPGRVEIVADVQPAAVHAGLAALA